MSASKTPTSKISRGLPRPRAEVHGTRIVSETSQKTNVVPTREEKEEAHVVADRCQEGSGHLLVRGGASLNAPGKGVTFSLVAHSTAWSKWSLNMLMTSSSSRFSSPSWVREQHQRVVIEQD